MGPNPVTYPVDSKSREELKGQAETVQAAMAALGQAYLNHSQAKAMLAAASVELSRCEREVYAAEDGKARAIDQVATELDLPDGNYVYDSVTGAFNQKD